MDAVRAKRRKLFVLVMFSGIATAQQNTPPNQQVKPEVSTQQNANYPIVESLPEHLLYIYTKDETITEPSLAERQLTANARRWEKDRVLRVCLFGGNRAVAELIRQVGGEWNRVSNVKFDFGPSNSWYNCLAPTQGFFQIRIGFGERGYWSAVGNDAERRLLPLQPSMNLEGFDFYYSDLRFQPGAVVANARPYDRAIIRHEFGHALGLLHEHQNPSLNCHQQIRWKGQGNVFEYFGRTNGWNPAQVERNLGYVRATDPDYEAGDPDPKSVMMYALPAEIFINGASSNCYVTVNYEISPKDAQIAARLFAPNTAGMAQSPGELETRTAKVAALPQYVDAPNRQDLIARIKTDLESTDKFVRRDARARLADVLEKGTTENEIAALVNQMSGASYRFQLGVAAGLAQARPAVQLNPSIKKELAHQARQAKDLTLKRTLQAAAK